MTKKIKKGIFLAILAAALYAISAPLSKILLQYIPPMLMAGLLYLGAGAGMGAIWLFRKCIKINKAEAKLTKKEMPFVIAMVVLDIAAPVSLMTGLNMTTAANASLLNNFEIVATAVIALVMFKEVISPRLWAGVALITASSFILSFEDITSFSFSYGSLFVLLACVCWGIENNCTRKISLKDPMQIVLIKGIFSGLGSVITGLIIGERLTVLFSVVAALGLGFVSYGLSIFFYVYAQRELGAARTSAFYAVAPFIGVAISLIIFRSDIGYAFIAALVIMIFGAYFASSDKPLFKKNIRNGSQ